MYRRLLVVFVGVWASVAFAAGNWAYYERFDQIGESIGGNQSFRYNAFYSSGTEYGLCSGMISLFSRITDETVRAVALQETAKSLNKEYSEVIGYCGKKLDQHKYLTNQ